MPTTVAQVERQRVTVAREVLSVAVRTGSPTVLLLHGLAGHSGEWAPVIEHLGAGVGIVSPDQRDHGATWELGTVGTDREAYVCDAEQLAERFASEPVVVVGQSMGGIVAALLAHKRPDLVAGLVLVEAGMSALTTADLTALRAWFQTWPTVFNNEADAAEFFGIDAPSTSAWIDGLALGPHGLSPRFDTDAMIETMKHLGSSSRWPEWSRIEAPTTLIRAEHGFLDDLEVERMLSLRPGTEIVVVNDSGHDVHLEQPEPVAKVVRNHLVRIAAMGRGARFG